MTEVFILLQGEPVAKGRPRFAQRGKFVTTYTPEKTREYENRVACEARLSMMDRQPMLGPISLDITIMLPIRKSWTKKAQEDARAGRTRPQGPSDWDNYCKSICDGMNRIVYMDDSQVVKASVELLYADDPCIAVTARPLDLGLNLEA